VSILKSILVFGICLLMFAMPVALLAIIMDTIKEFDTEIEID
jgi:hypothetical protein